MDAALTCTTLAYGVANCPDQPTSVTRAATLTEETTTTFSYDLVTCNLLTTTDDLEEPEYDSMIAERRLELTERKQRDGNYGTALLSIHPDERALLISGGESADEEVAGNVNRSSRYIQ